MNDLTRPISNRSLFGLTKVILSMKRGCFMDAMCKMTALSIKMAVFMDKVAELMVLSMKRDVFMDERIAQKRDTPERVSPYMALSREERLKNRGRPWPRERS